MRGRVSPRQSLCTDEPRCEVLCGISKCPRSRRHQVRLPPQGPNLNAHLERFFGSLKSECLDRLIFFGEESLRRAVKQYLAHYHQERSHQGLGNRLISPGEDAGRAGGAIDCRERLGGLLRYYYRRAA
ncbi:MAG: integrase core domain-containing protein [Pirellulaceae bacterium]